MSPLRLLGIGLGFVPLDTTVVTPQDPDTRFVCVVHCFIADGRVTAQVEHPDLTVTGYSRSEFSDDLVHICTENRELTFGRRMATFAR